MDHVPVKLSGKNVPTTKARTFAPVPAGMGLAYERFLRLPATVVPLVMWVVGAGLLGASALVAYAAVSALLGVVVLAP